jgi:hypothetical protein
MNSDLIDTLAGLPEAQRRQLAASLRERAAELVSVASRLEPVAATTPAIARNGHRWVFREEPFYCRVRRSWALRAPEVFRASGLTLEQLAAKLGVSVITAHNYLRSPAAGRADAIAAALGTTAEALFTPADDRPAA